MEEEPKSCDIRVDEAKNHDELIVIARDSGFTVRDLDSLAQINYNKNFKDLTLEEAKNVAKETCV